MLLLYLLLSLGGFRLQPEDPDALYKNREVVASAQQAEGIWADRLAKNPKDFESAWKLARARYWLGGHADERRRKAYLEAGIAAGRTAVALAPDKPDGHFWIAANMGALAESFGMRQGLKYRGDIKNALETVRRIDPAYLQGSADRALGRWYFKVPGLFGGSDKKSEEHLRKSLTYNPNSHASLFFLAETLIELNKKNDARTTLQKLLDAPVDPEWAPEDKEFKDKGRKLLAALGPGTPMAMRGSGQSRQPDRGRVLRVLRVPRVLRVRGSTGSEVRGSGPAPAAQPEPPENRENPEPEEPGEPEEPEEPRPRHRRR